MTTNQMNLTDLGLLNVNRKIIDSRKYAENLISTVGNVVVNSGVAASFDSNSYLYKSDLILDGEITIDTKGLYYPSETPQSLWLLYGSSSSVTLKFTSSEIYLLVGDEKVLKFSTPEIVDTTEIKAVVTLSETKISLLVYFNDRVYQKSINTEVITSINNFSTIYLGNDISNTSTYWKGNINLQEFSILKNKSLIYTPSTNYPINFTKILVSDGEFPLTDSSVPIVDHIVEFGINNITRTGNTVLLTSQLEDTTKLVIREIGLYAETNEGEILFSSVDGLNINKGADVPYDLIFTVNLEMSVVNAVGFPDVGSIVLADSEFISFKDFTTVKEVVLYVTTNLERIIALNATNIGYNRSQVFYKLQQEIEQNEDCYSTIQIYTKLMKNLKTIVEKEFNINSLNVMGNPEISENGEISNFSNNDYASALVRVYNNSPWELKSAITVPKNSEGTIEVLSSPSANQPVTANIIGLPDITDWGFTYDLSRSVYSPQIIAYGNGRFTGVGNSGHIATSTDGAAWTLLHQVENLKSATWSGIAFGNERFVVISSNSASTSFDGENWTEPTTLPSNNSWKDITFYENGPSTLKNKFVALSTKGSIAVSEDGTEWDIITPNNNFWNPFESESSAWRTISSSENCLMILDQGGLSSTSIDGINWTNPTIIEGNLTNYVSSAYGNHKFLALGDGSYSHATSSTTTYIPDYCYIKKRFFYTNGVTVTDVISGMSSNNIILLFSDLVLTQTGSQIVLKFNVSDASSSESQGILDPISIYIQNGYLMHNTEEICPIGDESLYIKLERTDANHVNIYYKKEEIEEFTLVALDELLRTTFIRLGDRGDYSTYFQGSIDLKNSYYESTPSQREYFAQAGEGYTLNWSPPSTIVPSIYEGLYLTYSNNKFVLLSSGLFIYSSEDGTDWTINTPYSILNPDSIYAIAYNNSNYFMLTNSYILTSTNGTEWVNSGNRIPSGLSNPRITYGNYKFVALTSTGRISTSDDGLNWTTVTTVDNLGSRNWSNLSYGNGVFVCVSLSGGWVSTSTDGINWVEATVNSTLRTYTFNGALTFFNGRFILVAYAGETFTSLDGVDWTIISTKKLPQQGCYSLSSVGNKLVLATNNSILTSTDNGYTWLNTGKTYSSMSQPQLLITKDIALRYPYRGYLLTSTTSKSPFFNLSLSEEENLQAVINSDDVDYFRNSNENLSMFHKYFINPDNVVTIDASNIATSFNGESLEVPIIETSADYSLEESITFTTPLNTSAYTIPMQSTENGYEINLTKSLSTNPSININFKQKGAFVWTEDNEALSRTPWCALAYGNEKFVALSREGIISTSTDGINWTSETQVLATRQWSLTYGNGKFVAFGSEGYIYTSEDGENWTEQLRLAEFDCIDVTYGNEKFLALSLDGYISTSEDGENWTEPIQVLDSNITWDNITYGNGKFVAVGLFGYVSTSTDGINWTEAPRITTNRTTCLAYGDNKFVVLGSSGYLYTSTDGINWTESEQVLNARTWAALTYGDEKFVALSINGYIATTTDLVTSLSYPSLQLGSQYTLSLTTSKNENSTYTLTGEISLNGTSSSLGQASFSLIEPLKASSLTFSGDNLNDYSLNLTRTSLTADGKSLINTHRSLQGWTTTQEVSKYNLHFTSSSSVVDSPILTPSEEDTEITWNYTDISTNYWSMNLKIRTDDISSDPNDIQYIIGSSSTALNEAPFKLYIQNYRLIAEFNNSDLYCWSNNSKTVYTTTPVPSPRDTILSVDGNPIGYVTSYTASTNKINAYVGSSQIVETFSKSSPDEEIPSTILMSRENVYRFSVYYIKISYDGTKYNLYYKLSPESTSIYPIEESLVHFSKTPVSFNSNGPIAFGSSNNTDKFLGDLYMDDCSFGFDDYHWNATSLLTSVLTEFIDSSTEDPLFDTDGYEILEEIPYIVSNGEILNKTVFEIAPERPNYFKISYGEDTEGKFYAVENSLDDNYYTQALKEYSNKVINPANNLYFGVQPTYYRNIINPVISSPLIGTIHLLNTSLSSGDNIWMPYDETVLQNSKLIQYYHIPTINKGLYTVHDICDASNEDRTLTVLENTFTGNKDLIDFSSGDFTVCTKAWLQDSNDKILFTKVDPTGKPYCTLELVNQTLKFSLYTVDGNTEGTISVEKELAIEEYASYESYPILISLIMKENDGIYTLQMYKNNELIAENNFGISGFKEASNYYLANYTSQEPELIYVSDLLVIKGAITASELYYITNLTDTNY